MLKEIDGQVCLSRKLTAIDLKLLAEDMFIKEVDSNRSKAVS